MKNKYSEILKKDPIVSTFIATDLLKIPEKVEEIYSEHAFTHISLGNTEEYIKKIINTVTQNKKCGVGAVVGPYGYGKTSTAIHIWFQLTESGFFAIPPFRWHNLSQFIEAVYGWAGFIIGKKSGVLRNELDNVYKRFTDKSIKDIVGKYKITESQAENMYFDNTLNLEFTYQQLIEFCNIVSDKALKSGFKGMVILTDELQETLEKYKDRDSFVTDLFGICGDLLNQEGNWTIIWGMPEQTETYLNTERKDILDRMKDRQIYFRLTELYNSSFPMQLWEKYSKSFGFEENIYEALNRDVLISLGQIAFRKDLGRGPRTVIQSLKVGVEYFIKNNAPFSIFNLMDAFNEKKITFDEFGKLNEALAKAFNHDLIKQDDKNKRIIELAASFPDGVPEAFWEKYDLAEKFEEIGSRIAGDLLIVRTNGYTLKALMEHGEIREPFFVSRLRAKLQRYTPSLPMLDSLSPVYLKALFEPLFYDWKGWDKPGKWSGYFLKGNMENFPEKTFAFVAGDPDRNSKSEIKKKEPDITLIFDLKQSDEPLTVKEKSSEYYFDIPLKRRPGMASLNAPVIPYIKDLYSRERIDIFLLLFILKTLSEETEKGAIPKAELDLPDFKRFIKAVRTNLWLALYGSEVNLPENINIQDKDEAFWKAFINRILQKRFSEYNTLIQFRDWQKLVENYYVSRLIKLSDLTIKQIRGKSLIKAEKNWWAKTFDVKVSTLTARFDIFQKMFLLSFTDSGKDTLEVKLQIHPFEKLIISLLEKSTKTKKENNLICKTVKKDEVYSLGKNKGYTEEETDTIISILEARKYIRSEKDIFVQSLDSVEEQKNLLIKDMESLENELLTALDSDSDFEEAIWPEKEKLESLLKKIEKVNDSEELEDYQKKFRSISLSVQEIFHNKIGNIQREVSRLLNIFRSSADEISNLKKKLGDEFVDSRSWSNFLNNKRKSFIQQSEGIILKISVQTENFKKVLETLKRETSGFNPEAIGEYKKITDEGENQLELLNERFSFISLQIKNLLLWKDLIPVFQRTERLTALLDKQELFDYSEKLENINSSIVDYLSKVQRTDQIDLPEPYIEKLEELEQECREISVFFREDFEGKRIELEKIFVLMKFERRLRTNFDPESPAHSENSLYEEFSEISNNWLKNKEEHIKSIKAEGIYALKHSDKDSLADLNDKCSQVTDILNNISSILTKPDGFKSEINEIIRLIQEASELEQIINKERREWLLPDTHLSVDAVDLLKRLRELQNNRIIDIRHLLIEEIKHDHPEEILLQQVMELFSKNYIDLKINLRN